MNQAVNNPPLNSERLGQLSAVVWTGWVPPKSPYLYHGLRDLTHWTTFRCAQPKQHIGPVVPASISVKSAGYTGGDVYWTNWGSQERALLTPEGEIWSTDTGGAKYRLPEVPSQNPVRYLGGFNEKPLLAQADETWILDSDGWHEMPPSPSDSELACLRQELQIRSLVHLAFCDAVSTPDKTRMLDGTRWVEPPRHVLGLRAFPTFVEQLPHVVTQPKNMIIPTMDGWAEGDPHKPEQFFTREGERHIETYAANAINTIHAVEICLKRLIRGAGMRPMRTHELDVLFGQLTPDQQTTLEFRFATQSFTLKEIVAHGGKPPRLGDLLAFWGSKSGGMPTDTDMYTFLRYEAESIPTMLFLGAVIAAAEMMESGSEFLWPGWQRSIGAEIGWSER